MDKVFKKAAFGSHGVFLVQHLKRMILAGWVPCNYTSVQ
jgi:hypothetical protein